jgi:hypothetical protein
MDTGKNTPACTFSQICDSVRRQQAGSDCRANEPTSYESASPIRIQTDQRCAIKKEDAVSIFLAKRGKKPRDGLAVRLAGIYGVTPKAVYDIWNMRTWRSVTKAYWTADKNCREQQKTKGPETTDKTTLARSTIWKRADDNSGGLLEEALSWMEQSC